MPDAVAHPGTPLLEARPKPWFQRWFSGYSRKLVSKRFYALRVDAGTHGLLADSDSHSGPLLCVMNHSSWWDPITGLVLQSCYLPSRSMLAPMDRAQLERFWFFRYLGMFGISPDNPASLEAMRDYLSEWFAREQHGTVWLTPQGDFQDPRDELVVRPGASALAAALGERTKVISAAIEYGFWTDQKPELFVRFAQVIPEKHSTTGWHRALVSTMALNQAELARLVIARDPTGFVNLLGGEVSKTNPAWDLLLKLRGKQGGIAPARRNAHSNSGETA